MDQDYSLRAKDHKKKQTVLKSLKQKAAERNEDEFYFGMVSRGKFSSGKLAAGKKWDGTVAGDRGNKALDMDTVRLLKTQDIGYLRTVRSVVAKEVRELEQKAVIAGAFAGVDGEEEEDDDFDSDEDIAPRKAKAPSKPKKIVFAASEEELEEKLPEPEDSDDDVDMDDDDFEKFDDEKDREARKRAQNAERLRTKLRNARKKLKALTDAENELELQRARMAKTATVASITKRGQKIKVRERKK